MSDSLFLKAFDGTNEKTPVWFMRQAGRYLPEYQAIRRNHDLNDMFRNPEIAAEVTCQPIDILGVDAAILFADILTLPSLMGADIHFDPQKGPIITPIKRVSSLNDIDSIEYVGRTIGLVQNELKGKVPLIGFAGSPFTVMTYLIEGGSTTNFRKTINFMCTQTEEYHALMEILTRNTITYLEMQKQAGIDVFQLFDSWIGVLNKDIYTQYVLPYVQQIFNRVDLPSIYFAKHAPHLLEVIEPINFDFLSVCDLVDFDNPIIAKSNKGIQGNLFNGLLYADDQTLIAETTKVLTKAKSLKKHIFNLGHGIFPDVNPNKLKLIVDTVHNFS